LEFCLRRTDRIYYISENPKSKLTTTLSGNDVSEPLKGIF